MNELWKEYNATKQQEALKIRAFKDACSKVEGERRGVYWKIKLKPEKIKRFDFFGMLWVRIERESALTSDCS